MSFYLRFYRCVAYHAYVPFLSFGVKCLHKKSADCIAAVGTEKLFFELFILQKSCYLAKSTRVV